jgi:hypothetical protein
MNMKIMQIIVEKTIELKIWYNYDEDTTSLKNEYIVKYYVFYT